MKTLPCRLTAEHACSATRERLGQGKLLTLPSAIVTPQTTNSQPMVDESVERDGASPPVFRGVWEHESYQQLLGNAIQWGVG
ncbi:MAG: hypothetical protein CM1200mP9_08490 [Gammaproteobacteria bacterium]|nr:MAG: hypothetical protein CM1200mP9_08490 [Gammaproteobacteria bacterium]